MAEEEQPTAEALKQKRKRAKKAAEDAAKGVELVQVEIAGGFKASIKRLMNEHGFNSQQEVYQNLLRNVIAADFNTAAQTQACHDTLRAKRKSVASISGNEPGRPKSQSGR